MPRMYFMGKIIGDYRCQFQASPGTLSRNSSQRSSASSCSSISAKRNTTRSTDTKSSTQQQSSRLSPLLTPKGLRGNSRAGNGRIGDTLDKQGAASSTKSRSSTAVKVTSGRGTDGTRVTTVTTRSPAVRTTPPSGSMAVKSTVSNGRTLNTVIPSAQRMQRGNITSVSTTTTRAQSKPGVTGDADLMSLSERHRITLKDTESPGQTRSAMSSSQKSSKRIFKETLKVSSWSCFRYYYSNYYYNYYYCITAYGTCTS